MVASAAAAILLKPSVWELAQQWPDARMPTDWERRVARVFRAQSIFCARTLCGRSSCLAVHQSPTSMEPISMFRETGLRNDDARMRRFVNRYIGVPIQ